MSEDIRMLSDNYCQKIVQKWVKIIAEIKNPMERVHTMKLLGFLKDKVDKAETKEEKKNIIAEAGMELTDDELEGVAGGKNKPPKPSIEREWEYLHQKN